jgi:hypothetical protein
MKELRNHASNRHSEWLKPRARSHGQLVAVAYSTPPANGH